MKSKRIHLSIAIILFLSVSTISSTVCAADWSSVSLDNDVFVANDSGYTNGLYVSWFDVGRNSGEKPQPLWPVRLLLWSLPDEATDYTVNAHTIGQMMVTPDDITLEDPDPNDIPYSGLLFYANCYMKIYPGHVDTVTTSLGVIGPASGAEQSQKLAHRLTGDDEPKGWDKQLKNEPVFQFARGRTWRGWVSGEGAGSMDILFTSDIKIGTLESSIGGSVMFRYGRGLSVSYPTAVLRSNRAANPLAIENGWYFYLGLGVRYYGNLIFTDGNTFQDSRSVDLDPTQIGAVAGISYSWDSFSLTLAVEDQTLFEDRYEGLSRYGTLTAAWRI